MIIYLLGNIAHWIIVLSTYNRYQLLVVPCGFTGAVKKNGENDDVDEKSMSFSV